MNRVSLKNMTEEEKKTHKRKLHRLHQRKYYEKNKDYYRNYQRNWAKQFNEEIIKIKSQNKSLSAENSYYKHIINELEKEINNQLNMTRKFDKYNEGYFNATLNYYNKLKALKEGK